MITLTLAYKNSQQYLVNVFGVRGAQSNHCYGFIFGTDRVLTSAHCVYGYKEVKVCQSFQTYKCPQDPVNCHKPTQVLLHQTFVDTIRIGDIVVPFAILLFKPNTFRADQIISIKFDQSCKCENLLHKIGYTYECFGSNFGKTKVKIVDFTVDGLKYGYPKNFWPFYYVLPTSEQSTCIGLAGAPLFVNDSVVAINSFCRPRCDSCPSYTLFFCLSFLEPLIADLSSAFVDLEVVNQQYYDYSLDQQLTIQRLLDPYNRPNCRFEYITTRNDGEL